MQGFLIGSVVVFSAVFFPGLTVDDPRIGCDNPTGYLLYVGSIFGIIGGLVGLPLGALIGSKEIYIFAEESNKNSLND